MTGIGRPVGPSSPGTSAGAWASGSGARASKGSKGMGSVMGEVIASLGSVGSGSGGGGATLGGISGAAVDPRPNRAPNRCAPSLIELSSALGCPDTQQPNLSTRRLVVDAPGTLGATAKAGQEVREIPPATIEICGRAV